MKTTAYRVIAGAVAAMSAFVGAVNAGELINLYMARSDVLVIHFHDVTRSLTESARNEMAIESRYTISSTDDPAYSSPTYVSQAKRKWKTLNVGATSETYYRNSLEMWLALTLPSALQSGKSYSLAIDPSVSSQISFAETTFVFREKQMYSEAIHVNNIGYLGDASMKYGYVSHYLGEMGGINYASGTRFQLMNTETGARVFTGSLKERTSGTGHYKTRVWECDFSSFSTPGEYRLVVQGVGCSYPFEIGIDSYRQVFQGACRGMLHQRCGCELTPEVTLWHKPRCHHSDDIPAFQTTSGFVNDDPKALAAKATNERIEHWGAWHDAGDHDHYASHFKVPYMLFAAYELNPRRFSDGELNIPESGNGIPDILDEARWGVDFYRRLQKSNGMVPEYTTPYPKPGSLDDATAIYASVPRSGVTLQYAGMAAAMGYFLKKFGKHTQAAGYIESARKAYGAGGSGTNRAAAALWLWRATRDGSYHSTFKNNRPGCSGHDDLETYLCASYVLAPEADNNVVDAMKSGIVNRAEKYISTINGDAMRSYRYLNFLGGQTLPGTAALVLAYKVTGKKRYRDYHAVVCDYFLGGNPLNMTWMTGMGEKHPINILNVEYEQRWAPRGLEAPLGIVPYGPTAKSRQSSNNWCYKIGNAHNGCYPSSDQWSLAEMWWEWPGLVCVDEYTIHQTVGPSVFMYAALCDDQVSRTWPTPSEMQPVSTVREVPRKAQMRIWRLGRQVRIDAPAPVRAEGFDMSGRRLISRAASRRHCLPLAGDAPGAYLVRVHTGGTAHCRLVGIDR